MIIIETCPECGHDLRDLVIATYPPIPRKVCPNCGWSWVGEPEQIMRVPFGGNSINTTSTEFTLNDYLNNFSYKDSIVYNFEQSARVNCSNNPKNGGSGICHCTLGQMHIT